MHALFQTNACALCDSSPVAAIRRTVRIVMAINRLPSQARRAQPRGKDAARWGNRPGSRCGREGAGQKRTRPGRLCAPRAGRHSGRRPRGRDRGANGSASIRRRCARRTLERVGLSGFAGLCGCDLGIEKGKSPVNPERVERVFQRAQEILAERTQPSSAARTATARTS